MNNKRLSIIIPFYNVEQYIAQCLDSVYHQDISEEEYEVICVDDCSPDNSIEIVEMYARQHSNLTIIRNKFNRKLGGARNAGMEVATGKYVWFIDSDDFIETNCFQKLLHILETYNLDVLHFNYLEYPDNHLPDIRPVDTEVMTGVEMFFHDNFIWFHDLVTAWRKLYKRQFLIENNIKFAEHIMFEDNDYAIKVFANAVRVKHIVNALYHYRNNPESITRIEYNSSHISYWLDLVFRLCELNDKFIIEQKDPRFISLIVDFIKYTINNIIHVYSRMVGSSKSKASMIINRRVDKTLKPYISKKVYYQIKLGLL